MLRCAGRCRRRPPLRPDRSARSPARSSSRVLVQPGPGKFEQRSPQGGVLRADQGIGLHEQARPRGACGVPHPGLGECGDIERAADRRRRNSMREMHQIADESPRSGERQISAFRFVHPCTSRGLRSAQVDRRPHNSMLRGARLDAGHIDPAGRVEAYRKSRGGEGEACKNESRTGSVRIRTRTGGPAGSSS